MITKNYIPRKEAKPRYVATQHREGVTIHGFGNTFEEAMTECMDKAYEN